MVEHKVETDVAVDSANLTAGRTAQALGTARLKDCSAGMKEIWGLQSEEDILEARIRR